MDGHSVVVVGRCGSSVSEVLIFRKSCTCVVHLVSDACRGNGFDFVRGVFLLRESVGNRSSCLVSVASQGIGGVDLVRGVRLQRLLFHSLSGSLADRLRSLHNIIDDLLTCLIGGCLGLLCVDNLCLLSV